MKSILCTLAFLLMATYGIKAQILYVPNGTNGIANSNNQNIGIGISTPTAQLDIVSNSAVGRININTLTEEVAIIGGGTSLETTPFALRVQHYNAAFSPATNTTVALLDGRGKLTLGNLAGISLDSDKYLNFRRGLAGYLDANNYFAIKAESFGTTFTWGENGTYTDLNFIFSGNTLPSAQLSQNGKFTLRSNVTTPGSGEVNGLEINNDGSHNDDYAIRINTDLGAIFRLANNGRIFIGESLNNGANIEEYRLFVETGIRTEKIRVDVAADNGWADFVFEEDYPMMTTEELHAFIKKNKHLPNVPSAAQVAEEGIDLAEMNAILLRQIEELTLRVIELEGKLEQIDEQKLIGKWILVGVKEGVEEYHDTNYPKILEIKSNNQYKKVQQGNITEEGNWALNDDAITFSSFLGEIDEFTIDSLGDFELIIKILGRHGYVYFKYKKSNDK